MIGHHSRSKMKMKNAFTLTFLRFVIKNRKNIQLKMNFFMLKMNIMSFQYIAFYGSIIILSHSLRSIKVAFVRYFNPSSVI